MRRPPRWCSWPRHDHFASTLFHAPCNVVESLLAKSHANGCLISALRVSCVPECPCSCVLYQLASTHKFTVSK